MDEKTKEEINGKLEELKQEFKKKVSSVFKGSAGVKPEGLVSNIKRFDLLKEFPQHVINDHFSVAHGNSLVELFIIKTQSEFRARSARMEFMDLFCFCVFPGQKDFGRSIIRTETILDKIAEVFSPCEHDFDEYPEFSAAYCCFSNEPEKLRSQLSPEITELFLSFKNKISVEFGFGMCLVMHPFSLKEMKQNLYLIDFALKLREIISC